MVEEGIGMNEDASISILPYTRVVGQEQLKLALELAYIAPRISGVLISGERGTGKSTIVRAFSQLVYGALPVTIPINATEDRVVGGWQIDELMRGESKPQKGLLEEANGKLLYVDEVNLLDDHIVNIILDVSSTDVLVVQREGLDHQKSVHFTLVGTMNPEEGSLRPQLLDRFGLMVRIAAEKDLAVRLKILATIQAFDEALFKRRNGQPEDFFDAASKSNLDYKAMLEQARQNYHLVEIPEDVARACILLASRFQIEGHRGDYVMLLAARAYAAREGYKQVTLDHLRTVAPLALQHRRPEARELNRILWGEEEAKRLAEPLDNVSS
jgi:magnesium chelatase subunit I